ncbi:MAG: hypothetical protein J6N72_04860 [Psychrobacter sp.]|nr:hypothetical protein [Psychrobacter sp.]
MTYSESVESFLGSIPNMMSRKLMENLIERIGGEHKFSEHYKRVSKVYEFTGVEGISTEEQVVDLFNKNFSEIKNMFDDIALSRNFGAGIEYLLSQRELTQNYGLTPIQIVDSFYAPLDSANESNSKRVALCFWMVSLLYFKLFETYRKHLLKNKNIAYSDDINCFIKTNKINELLTIAVIEQFGGEAVFLDVYEEVAEKGIHVGAGYWFGHNHTAAFFKAHKPDIIEFMSEEAKNRGMLSHVELISKLSSKGIANVQSVLTGDVEDHSIVSAILWFLAEETTREYKILSGE